MTPRVACFNAHTIYWFTVVALAKRINDNLDRYGSLMCELYTLKNIYQQFHIKRFAVQASDQMQIQIYCISLCIPSIYIVN